MKTYKTDPEWNQARVRFYATVREHLSAVEAEVYKARVVRAYLLTQGAALPAYLSLGLVPPRKLNNLCERLRRLSRAQREAVLRWGVLSDEARVERVLQLGRTGGEVRGAEALAWKQDLEDLGLARAHGVKGLEVYQGQHPDGELRVVVRGARLSASLL